MRSRAEALGIDPDTFKESDIHLHIPRAPSPRTALARASPWPRR
ncbi:MAG: S16 family serine protease [Caldilineaceae bacterium]